ncbi:MAG: DUF5668 domain-containing protein [Chryseolinea sp.]
MSTYLFYAVIYNIIESKMETQDNSNKEFNKVENKFHGGRVLGGLIVVGVGAILLAKQVGTEFPDWMFSWPVILIVIGVYTGARHRFRNVGWLIPVAIGSAFLLDEIIPELDFGHFVWPVLIITTGLIMIFKRSRHEEFYKKWERDHNNEASTEGMIDSVVFFGENKKQILSKDFKGGESVCVFGGIEVNLTQADIQGRVYLELVQVFGGAKLIVPSHWKIESEEMVSVFGGLNDKRQLQNTVTDHTKTLVLRGTSVFGGIDIKSF